jgi:hypothetical protein
MKKKRRNKMMDNKIINKKRKELEEEFGKWHKKWLKEL